MKFYLIVLVIKISNIHSAVLQTSRHITSDTLNKINEIGKSEDYIRKDVMISGNENEYRFDNVENGKTFGKKHTYKELNGNDEIGIFSKLASHSPHKTILYFETDNNYDYKYLLDEYYEEALNESRFSTNYRVNNEDAAATNVISTIRKMLDLQSKKCSKGDIGFKAIKCLFVDYHKRKQPFCVFLSRLWKIIRTWLLIYIVLAIPLWCTRGLCCCCLFCNFFKPHQIIEKAKRYFIMNPPGLLKTTKGHEVLYEPTKSERCTYEEFEHLIRTI